MFIHDDPQFHQLLELTSRARSLSVAAVASDYWSVHVLWALQHQGFEVSLRAGAALSKGFGLISRSTSHLDVKIGPGRSGLTPVSDWRSRSESASQERRSFFEGLAQTLRVPGAKAALGEADRLWRSASIRVLYPSAPEAAAPSPAQAHLTLAVHDAWFKPSVVRPLRAFVHDELDQRRPGRHYEDNRPDVPCVHPLVTLLEKLAVLESVVPDSSVPAAQFVRHFEDAARIVSSVDQLPALTGYSSIFELASDMRADRQLRSLPSSMHDAFQPDHSARWQDIRSAHELTAAKSRGPQLSLDEVCQTLRSWIDGNIG
jgi:hypothetical protein